MSEEKQSSDRRGMLIGGTIVLGVGLLFLLINLDIVPGMHDMWPVFLIIVGVAVIVGGFYKGKRGGGPD